MDWPQPNNPHSLTTSEPSSTSISYASPLTTGNGESIFTSSILPVLATAKHEILLVTCFWAPSPTLSALSTLLINLSGLALRRPSPQHKLRIRIGFSSRSLFQKLLHTSSPTGHTYPPSTWASHLHLPSPSKLQGLDLQVKSIFHLPLSVLHPKFILLDREHAILPSFNLSWESWLECCIPLSGPIVVSLLSFWRETWGRNDLPPLSISTSSPPPSTPHEHSIQCETTLLPSPHHRNPRFRPWPLAAPAPPPTPLNNTLLHLFSTAKTHIHILTPNLTSPPVLSALFSALARGVDVTIITNRRMMLLEQLLTAGTITELCVWRLRRRYTALRAGSDVEQSRAVGTLTIGYFQPVANSGPEVKCHVKCTIVDGRVVVLGSGNMDRASWFTSQELGVAIQDKEVVAQVKGELERALEGRVEWYCS